MNISKVSKLMNQYTEAGIPFLVMVDFELQKPRIYRLDRTPESIRYNFNGKKNYLNGFAKSTLDLIPDHVSLTQYASKFGRVVDELNYGNSFLLNLSVKTKITNEILLSDLFYNSTAKYRLLVDDEFVVFSPETFIQIKENKIYTFPMKGTIDADIEDAEQQILDNKKEAAEHYTIVDLLRNDLSLVAKKVTVDRLRYVDELRTNNKNLLQVSSQISGDLSKKWKEKLGDIFFGLLPAGSISGAPKKKTVELIAEIEGENRGYYTGVAGIFDGDTFDSMVMIRFVEKDGNEYFYRSGGGITAQSDLISEYEEINDKIYVPIH